MLPMQLLQRRQQILAHGCAERCRLVVDDDGPERAACHVIT
jgi:hypothetical protein